MLQIPLSSCGATNVAVRCRSPLIAIKLPCAAALCLRGEKMLRIVENQVSLWALHVCVRACMMGVWSIQATNKEDRMMVKTEEAMRVVQECGAEGAFALAQALSFAAEVAACNARHPYSEWTAKEEESVRQYAGNPDLVRELGTDALDWLEG